MPGTGCKWASPRQDVGKGHLSADAAMGSDHRDQPAQWMFPGCPGPDCSPLSLCTSWLSNCVPVLTGPCWTISVKLSESPVPFIHPGPLSSSAAQSCQPRGCESTIGAFAVCCTTTFCSACVVHFKTQVCSGHQVLYSTKGGRCSHPSACSEVDSSYLTGADQSIPDMLRHLRTLFVTAASNFGSSLHRPGFSAPTNIAAVEGTRSRTIR